MSGESGGWRRLAVAVLGGIAIAVGSGLGATRSEALSAENVVAVVGVVALTVFFVVLGRQLT